jgi:hypothetical protein
MSETFEGVPSGYEVVRFGQPKTGECYMDGWGEIVKCCDSNFSNCRLIIKRLHKDPELVLCLDRGSLELTKTHAWQNIHIKELIELNWNQDFDMILVGINGNMNICLGHWNDGVRK